jgi:CheY-like chemotaxis protein
MDEQRLILVVEDDDATRAFLVENLSADGFRAVGATSAGEGIRAIEVRRPSLVVLDLALEGGSGLDLLDRVRHADGLASRTTTSTSRRVVFRGGGSRPWGGLSLSARPQCAAFRERGSLDVRSVPRQDTPCLAANYSIMR